MCRTKEAGLDILPAMLRGPAIKTLQEVSEQSALQDRDASVSNQISMIWMHMTWIVTTHDIIVHTSVLIVTHTS